MTLEEARDEVGTIDNFCYGMCVHCTANDWFCPSYCDILEKARRMPFEKLLKSYARNDGDPIRLWRYIKRYKVKDNESVH
jgi:hypothetical protein